MKYIQTPIFLLPLLGLSWLSFFCFFTSCQNNADGEGELLSRLNGFAINLPLVLTAPELPRMPGFVPPDFEASPFEVPVLLPACDQNALIVDANFDLRQIDWHAYDVFCLQAGDYTKWGEILIQDVSGTANQPKVLRYYDPTDATPPHPVRRADSSGPEVIILQLLLEGSNYWILDGLTIRNSPEDNRVTDSSQNIFNRLLIEEGDAVLLRIDRDSDDNVVQNSVLRNHSAKALKNDEVCILLYTKDWDHVGIEIENTRIVNNEIYNCNDGVNLLRSPEDRPAFYPGTIVANNDIYITEELYTDCKGNPDPSGACACSENAVDIKATIKQEDKTNAEKWVRFINNRIWGYRYTDATKDNQGNRLCASGGGGSAIQSHFDARNLVIEGNVILDSSRGVSGGGAMESDQPNTNHFLVNNLLFNLHDCYELDKQGMKQFYLEDQGRFIGCFDENDQPTRDRGKGLTTSENEHGPDHFGNTHFGNTLIDVGDSESLSGWWAYIHDASHAYECNAVLNSSGREYSEHKTNTADKNAYFDSVPYCPTSNPCEDQSLIIKPAVENAKHAPFTFYRRRWTGPEMITIPDAVHTSETPQFDAGVICWIDDPSHPWN